MSEKCLRWGMCGAGYITSDFCSALKTLPSDEHQIVAVASRSLEKANDYKIKFGARKAYGSYKDIANDAEIDVVYIGVRPTVHYALCRLMLNSGKHVLCETPLTMCLKHTTELLALAKEKKLFLMEGFWTLTLPIYRQIKQIIDNKDLGAINTVTANMYGSPEELDHQYDKKNGESILLEIGSFCIMFACLAYGKMPEKIIAEAFVNSTGTDEYGGILLRYSEGQTAVLSFSGQVRVIGGSADIHGDKGSIQIPHLFWCADEAVTPSGTIKTTMPQGPVKFFYPNDGGLSFEADAVRKAIIEGKIESPDVSHEMTKMVATIADEAQKLVGINFEDVTIKEI